MKKKNILYMAAWAAAAVLLVVLALALFLATGSDIMLLVCTAIFMADIFCIPMLKTKVMQKKAAQLAKDFPRQLTFEAHDGIFYFDSEKGRAAVVWRNNPFSLQTIDLTKVSGIEVKDGRQFRGTMRVWCQFLLNGEKIRIHTLWVSGNRQLGMQHPKVVSAISKAEQLAEVLSEARAKALS